MLVVFKTGMFQEFRYGFKGDTISKGNVGCNGMSGDMKSEILLDATQVSNFFQITV